MSPGRGGGILGSGGMAEGGGERDPGERRRGPIMKRDPLALTPREKEILELVSQGMADKEIAAKLFIAPVTVGNHLQNIREKLGVRSRGLAAAWWQREKCLRCPYRKG